MGARNRRRAMPLGGRQLRRKSEQLRLIGIVHDGLDLVGGRGGDPAGHFDLGGHAVMNAHLEPDGEAAIVGGGVLSGLPVGFEEFAQVIDGLGFEGGVEGLVRGGSGQSSL